MPESKDEAVGFQTSRGINGYSSEFGMGENGILEWLSGKKRVLDLGAGGGLLNKEIELMKRLSLKVPDTDIIPLDIAYGSKEGTEYSQYSTHLAFTNLGIHPTVELINDINSSFEDASVHGSFTATGFGDNEFEGVVACATMGIHLKSKEQMLTAYTEVFRILKEGGKVLISVIYNPVTQKLRTADKTRSESYTTKELESIGFSDIKLNKSSKTIGGKIIESWFLSATK